VLEIVARLPDANFSRDFRAKSGLSRDGGNSVCNELATKIQEDICFQREGLG
jgi:hypothetical protein